MTHTCRTLAVACSALGILLGTAGESRACFGCNACAPAGTTTYRPLFPFLTGYRGVAAGCCSPCSTCASPCSCAPCNTCASPCTSFYSPCNTCASPCASGCAPMSGCNTCSRVAYLPTVAYRPVMGCGGCGSCGGCGVTTTLRPIVTYQQPAYYAPASSYQVLPGVGSGCSNCGNALMSYPTAPAASQIVSQASPAATYGTAPIVSTAPPTTTYRTLPSSSAAGTTVQAPSGSFTPPGGSYSSSPPALSAPVTPRPGPTDSLDASGAGRQTSVYDDTRLRRPAQQPSADLRAGGSKLTPPLLKNADGVDRTTQLPSHRTWSNQPLEAPQQTVIQAQHVRPAKKKLDDGGWRPAR